MTIAACYVTPEGVALGADSTASAFLDASGFHFYNHTQKLFEVGQNSSLGIVTWGMSSIGAMSHRTLVAVLADDLSKKRATSVKDATDRFATKVSLIYAAALKTQIDRFDLLNLKAPYSALAVPAPDRRTDAKEKELRGLRIACILGFCIGGHALPDRTPHAFCINFDILNGSNPKVSEIPMNTSLFWGAPKIFGRLINGIDDEAKEDLRKSAKWTGTDAELDAILGKHVLKHAQLPIREAVDFIHTCIIATIKAIKFSSMPQICGGPVEIATITSDRNFRWTRHKEWDSAIEEGNNGNQ